MKFDIDNNNYKKYNYMKMAKVKRLLVILNLKL